MLHRFIVTATLTMSLLSLGITRARGETSAVAIAPSGSWTLAPGDGDCTLSRDYGAGADAKTLGFRPSWSGAIEVILLVTPVSSDRTVHFDPVKIRLGTNKEIIQTASQSGIVGKQRVTEIFRTRPDAKTDDPTLPDPPIASTITLQVGKQDPVTFAMPGAVAGFAALAKCQDALMDRLGVFPYERRRFVRDRTGTDAIVSPIGNPAAWITADDYPTTALKAGQQGDSVIFWTITKDGVVKDCRTLFSSGFASLDQAACNALTRRGRYLPALNEQGQAVAIHNARRVLWRLP